MVEDWRVSPKPQKAEYCEREKRMTKKRAFIGIGLSLGAYVLFVGFTVLWLYWDRRWFAVVLLSLLILYVLGVALVAHALQHGKLHVFANAMSSAFLGALLVLFLWRITPLHFGELALNDKLPYSVVLGLVLLVLLSGLLEPLIISRAK